MDVGARYRTALLQAARAWQDSIPVDTWAFKENDALITHFQGPPGCSKSVLVPGFTSMSGLSNSSGNSIIYGVSSVLKAEILAAAINGVRYELNCGKADVCPWPESKHAVTKPHDIHIMAYNDLDKMLRDPTFDLPEPVTFILELDLRGSVAFMMSMMQILDATRGRKCQLMTLSCEEPGPVLVGVARAFEAHYDYIYPPPGVQFIERARQELIAGSPQNPEFMARLMKVQTSFIDAPARSVLLFSGPRQMQQAWSDFPGIERIHLPHDAPLETLLEKAKDMEQYDRVVLTVDPHVMPSMAALGEFGITHVALMGVHRSKIFFDEKVGSPVEDVTEVVQGKIDATLEYWDAIRALNFAVKSGPGTLACTSISTPNAPVDDRVPLFEQEDLLAFFFRMVEFVNVCKFGPGRGPSWRFHTLVGVITHFGHIESMQFTDQMTRLSIAGYSICGPDGGGVEIPSTPRLRDSEAVFRLLHEVKNCLPAMRMIRGALTVHSGAARTVQYILVSMAVLLVYRPAVEFDDAVTSMSPEVFYEALTMVGREGKMGSKESRPNGLGYLWSALAAWEAWRENVPSDLISIDRDVLVRMTSMRNAVLHLLGLDGSILKYQKPTARQVHLIQQELICCSTERLFWVNLTRGGTQFPARGVANGYGVRDVVTATAVEVGDNCRLLDVGDLSKLVPGRTGLFAISAGPMQRRGETYVVDNLTYIADGVLADFCSTELVTDEGHIKRPYVADLPRLICSLYRPRH